MSTGNPGKNADWVYLSNYLGKLDLRIASNKA